MGCRGRGPFLFPCIRDVEGFGWAQSMDRARATVELRQGKIRKIERVPAVVDGFKCNALSFQGLAEKYAFMFPGELSARPNPAHDHGGAVLGFVHARGIGARGGQVSWA